MKATPSQTQHQKPNNVRVIKGSPSVVTKGTPRMVIPSSSGNKQRLLKTEMCRNMKLHGKCVHGNSCDFAHYEYELCSRTFSGRSANGMIPSSHTNIHEYLARPCVDFVATGSW
jgi:hypothetical protein